MFKFTDPLYYFAELWQQLLNKAIEVAPEIVTLENINPTT